MKRPIRVLIVDDSALVRQSLQDVLLDGSGNFEVMAMASDPFHAVRELRIDVPDVMLLDIEMPKMDGVTFLRKLMRQYPIPTVICSSLAHEGAQITFAALEAGAVDIITKPDISTREFFDEARHRIQSAVRAASLAKVRVANAPKVKVDKPAGSLLSHTTDRVIAIGASTGGTEALYAVLTGLDAHCPGIAIVQHMPAGFTATFAKRLDEHCAVHVREAKDGDPLLVGQVLIAPGDHHLEIRRNGARYVAAIHRQPAVNRHRPSVNVLFDSVAKNAGANAMGVILTGMGSDGASGLKAMRDSGAVTIAQDEASSVVFGMPHEAIKIGSAERVLPLDDISGAVLDWSHKLRRTAVR
jgi:two-component system, chemotaxis family, protein-glutamate methylesterase/glutaminase